MLHKIELELAFAELGIMLFAKAGGNSAKTARLKVSRELGKEFVVKKMLGNVLVTTIEKAEFRARKKWMKLAVNFWLGNNSLSRNKRNGEKR